MLGVVALRVTPRMSVVTLAIGWPAANTGAPSCGWRFVVELYRGLAEIEFASLPVAVLQDVIVVSSVNPKFPNVPAVAK